MDLDVYGCCEEALMSLRQSAVSGVKWTTLSTVVIAALQLVQLTFLARLLKPSDFGLMAMTMVVIGFAQAYADMGVSAALVHRQDITRQQLSSLYWLNISAGAAVFFVIWMASPLVVMFFHEPLLYRLLPVSAIGVLILSAGQQFHWLLEKDLRFNLLAKQDVCANIVAVLVTVTCAYLGEGVWSLVWGGLTGSVLKSALLIWAGWAKWPPSLHFRRDDLRGYLSFGLYQMGERSINYFNSRVDQLLIGSLLGAQELGYYNFAFNLVMQPVNTINPILTRVAFPVFARMQNDMDGLRQNYIKIVKMLCTVNAPLLFGFGAVAPLLVPLVFGTQWLPAILLIQILTLYGFLRSSGNPIGSLLLAKGRADLGFRWNLFLLFTTPSIVYVGAKLGGALGIATVLVMLMICYSAASYIFLVQALIGRCAKIYSSAILKPAALATVMASCVFTMHQAGFYGPVWLATEVAFGAVFYLGLLWLLDRPLLHETKMMLVETKS